MIAAHPDLASPAVTLHGRRREKDKGVLLYPDRLIGMKFTDTAYKRTNKVEVVFDNRDGLLSADNLLMKKGSLIRLGFGYPGAWRDAGDFVIKNRKPARGKLGVICHEFKRNKMSRTPPARHWYDAKRSDVVVDLLKRNGFTESQIEIDESILVLSEILQFSIGDFQFMEDLAREENREFWIDEQGPHWIKPRRNAKPAQRYKYKNGMISIGVLAAEPEVLAIGAGVPGRITFKGIDPSTGESYTVSAANTGDPKEAVEDLITLADTEDIDTVEQGDEDSDGNSGLDIERSVGYMPRAQAKTMVDTLYKEHTYAATRLKLQIFGDPFIEPRKIVGVWGLGPMIDGHFYTKTAVHPINNSSAYITTVECHKDGLNKKGGKQKNKQEAPDWAFDQHFAGRPPIQKVKFYD